MTQKIEIKPGDQSLIGVDVVFSTGKSKKLRISAVGDKLFLAIDEEGIESPHYIETAIGTFWELYKPKPLYAPAVISIYDKFRASKYWYHSEMEAKKDCEKQFIKWPAIPNAQGFYEI